MDYGYEDEIIFVARGSWYHSIDLESPSDPRVQFEDTVRVPLTISKPNLYSLSNRLFDKTVHQRLLKAYRLCITIAELFPCFKINPTELLSPEKKDEVKNCHEMSKKVKIFCVYSPCC
jgi:hypothetical protein